MHLPPKLLLLHILAATFLTSAARQRLRPAAGGTRSCEPHERDALLAFKHGISSDPMNLLVSWRKDGDCCRWTGVLCSNRTRHVLKLQLRNVHVTSSVSSSEDQFRSTALVGQISHSLLSLDRLVHLDLSMNNLTGSSGHIPDFLSSLVNLRYLNLSGIPFSGRVPPHLGNLSKLQYLDLSGSQDQDQLSYSTDISWLAGLPMLEYLSMSMVNLSRVVDWPDVMNLIPSLKVLSLSNCFLTWVDQPLSHINLTNLETLDLSNNKLDHPIEPSWLWNLTGLQYLNLTGNFLFGQVPAALGDMTSLQVLDLSFNFNKGTMTPSLKNLCNLTILGLRKCFQYGNMTELIEQLPQCPLNKLQELHLPNNNITGIMPSQMAHLTSLVVLDISGNHLSGAIPPGVGQLTSLRTLDLSDNKLSGHVPAEISMLANLTVLDLSSNKLKGDITEKHFERLSKLKILKLSGNSFKIRVSSEWRPPFSLQEANISYCQIGPLFPAWLRSQVNIDWVDMSNNGIVDKFPAWFTTALSKVTKLDFSGNKLHGKLPENMENMSLEYFCLSSNNITGQIPSLPRNLNYLDLSLNSLSGNLPSKYGTPNLVSLNLFSNHFTGGLSGSICELQSLVELDLANNHFEGDLPHCVTTTTLLFVLLRNNSFSGEFPLFLQNSKQLEFLDLSQNKFSGNLPHWIGGLVRLRFLLLSENMFSGNIPTSITNLTDLHHLNLASNMLAGVIPSGFSNLIAMTGKYVFDDNDAGENYYGGYEELSSHISGYFSAFTKGQQLYYKVGVVEMLSIDLSFNSLSGGIPEEIASLDALLNLDLSWNHLSEEIPDKIGIMKSLESLDLSNNVLSGEIPSSLSNLSYLSYMDLSHNNLTGRIPSGKQLDTIYMEYPSMYSGNSGLCGPPVQKLCSGNNNASRQAAQNINAHGFEPSSFYFGLGSGFVLGLWVVFCVLLFKKAWRVAYFRLFDRIYDQMYVLVGVTWKSLAGRAKLLTVESVRALNSNVGNTTSS